MTRSLRPENAIILVQYNAFYEASRVEDLNGLLEKVFPEPVLAFHRACHRLYSFRFVTKIRNQTPPPIILS